MNCPICNSSSNTILKEFQKSITSDSKMINGLVTIAICSDCGNLFNSHGSRHKTSDFYKNSYDLLGTSFQAETKVYGDKDELTLSDWRLKHLSSLKILPKTGKILDIGCGKGNFLKKFKILFPKWNLFGIEASNASLFIAKQNLPDLISYAGKYSKNPFDTKFDLIVGLNVLEHIENPRLFLENIFNDLNENALVCFDVPNFKVNPIDIFVYDHLTHFTAETLRNLLEHLGFKIIKLVENNDKVPIFVICKKNSTKQPLKNFFKMTKKLVEDSFSYNDDLFSIYDFVNKKFKQFGVIGLGIPIWVAIQNQMVDSSKIISFFDENTTLVGTKFQGIQVKQLNEISYAKSLPLIFSVSPCYIDNLKQKLFHHGNKIYLPKSYSYFLKYFSNQENL